MKLSKRSISIIIVAAAVVVATILIIPMLSPAAASKSLAGRMVLDPTDLQLYNYRDHGDPSSNSTWVEFTYDYLSVRLWLDVWTSSSEARTHFNETFEGNVSDGISDSYRYGNLTLGEDSRIDTIVTEYQHSLSITFVRGNVTVEMMCDFRIYAGAGWDYSVERALILTISQDLKIMEILGYNPVYLHYNRY